MCQNVGHNGRASHLRSSCIDSCSNRLKSTYQRGFGSCCTPPCRLASAHDVSRFPRRHDRQLIIRKFRGAGIDAELSSTITRSPPVAMFCVPALLNGEPLTVEYVPVVGL